ncbi:hypothetical protein FKP32DRAFT_1592871 [Trametes sanguinea]|nr:hypothetical protein FKP32DRAFT_1592871 [Trametes sanguinea]
MPTWTSGGIAASLQLDALAGKARNWSTAPYAVREHLLTPTIHSSSRTPRGRARHRQVLAGFWMCFCASPSEIFMIAVVIRRSALQEPQ